jgi:Sec-independent protein translocase protein TatA
MEILGVGPLELFLFLLIALIVLGPGDMVKAGRTLGRVLRKIVTSPEWRTIQKASRELRYLPNRLMREASIEDLSKDLADINKIGGQIGNEVKKVENDLSSWTTPPELRVNNIDDPASNGSPPTLSDTPINPASSDDNA